jgi:hypothetical protein
MPALLSTTPARLREPGKTGDFTDFAGALDPTWTQVVDGGVL